VSLFPGTQLLYDGDLVEVTEFDGAGVTIRSCRTGQFSAVRIGDLAARARLAGGTDPDAGDGPDPGLVLAGLTGGAARRGR